MRQPRIRDGFELSATRRTLPMALLRARESLMERFRPLLAAHGVTEQQWRVLRVLQENARPAGDQSEIVLTDASQLADAANILSPSLSRIIRTLETKGLIATHKDPQDGRRALISLTAEGAALIHQIAPASADIYAEIEARFGRARIDALLDEIQALVSVMADTVPATDTAENPASDTHD